MAHTPASRYHRLDERSLVESARTDAGAFAELYRRYVDRIYSYAYRRALSAAVAEDVTSATFEKALAGFAAYRWKEPGIGPWLFRIASNELVNVYRGDARQLRTAKALAAGTISSFAELGVKLDEHDDLHKALAAIRPRYQRALSLRYLADLTNEEAAAAMGVSRATMAVIVHRGAAALRRALVTTQPADEVVRHDR